ncbi:MAG: radical SAM protein [Chloroflexi bacterium]|nr:radical SAM protein [Chloroflexota bacterium]
MNILLLNPPPNERSWYLAEHLGIAFLAAVLRQAGHHVLLLDSLLEDIDTQQTAQAVLERLPNIDILGITAIEPETLKTGIQVVNLLNQAGLHPHITCGGYLPTFWSDEVLQKYPEIDTVVIGEGEETLKALVDTLQHGSDLSAVKGIAYREPSGEIQHTEPRPLIPDLDRLPFPARDYLAIAYQKYHHALVYTSRGCYHKCSFCQIAQFYRISPGGPYRTRSAKNIADEIELLVNQHGVRSIFFVDDEFITESRSRRKVIDELIAEIRARGLRFSFSIQYRADTGSDEPLLSALKEVGLSTVFIGVESGVDTVLQRFDKGIKKNNLSIALKIVRDLDFNLIAGYMLYNPGTTFEELKESVAYLLTPEAPFIQDLHGMNLLKGTPEEKLAHEQNMLVFRDMKVNYSIQNKKVAAFIDALRHYFPIYRAVVLDIYELLFLLVQLPEEIQNEKRAIDEKIRALHNRFLIQSISELEQGTFHEKELLESLRVEFDALAVESGQLVQKGRESVRG